MGMYWPQPATNYPTQYYYPYWPEPNTKPEYNFGTNLYYTCPHCGHWVWWGGKYCPNCGKELWGVSSQEETLKDIKRLLEELQKKVDSLSETKTEGKDK